MRSLVSLRLYPLALTLILSAAQAAEYDYVCNDYCTTDRSIYTVHSETGKISIPFRYESPLCNTLASRKPAPHATWDAVCFTPSKAMLFGWNKNPNGSFSPAFYGSPLNALSCLPSGVLEGKKTFTADEMNEAHLASLPANCGFIECKMIRWTSPAERKEYFEKLTLRGCNGRTLNDIPPEYRQ